MADFAPNFTARLRVKYATLGKTHSQLWRVASSTTSPTGIVGKVQAYYAAIQGFLFTDFVITGADWALADTDIFLPVTPPASPSGANDPATAKPTDTAVSLSFVARSTAGGKGKFFQYGSSAGLLIHDNKAADFRFFGTEEAPIAAAVTALNELSPALVCNDDHTAVWYDYANIKYNDFVVRKLRRG